MSASQSAAKQPGGPTAAVAPRSRITAITSGKGGVGKTFVSANLAAALADRGERVLVLDTDLGLTNLDAMLDLFPKLTLNDVFAGKNALEEAILPAPGGFSVLLAGSGMVESSRLTPDVRDQFQDVIAKIRSRFDRVLLDTGAGISDVVLYTISLADDVLVVATPEPTSLADAYASIKVLASQQRARPTWFLVNQGRHPGEARVIHRHLQHVIDRYVNDKLPDPLRIELLGEIPADSTVHEAAQRHQLLLEHFPGSRAAQAVSAVAARLAELTA